MKKSLFTISMLLLFLVPTVHATQLPEFPFVFATGEATIEVPPDIASVSFCVEQFDESEINALQDARESAELMSNGFGVKIGEVYAISKSGIILIQNLLQQGLKLLIQIIGLVLLQ